VEFGVLIPSRWAVSYVMRKGLRKIRERYIPTYIAGNLVDFAGTILHFTEQRLVQPRYRSARSRVHLAETGEWAVYSKMTGRFRSDLLANLGAALRNSGTFWDKQNSLRVRSVQF